MKKIILAAAAFVACTLTLSAQISEGGTPPSFSYPQLYAKKTFDHNVYRVPVNLDIPQLIKEDEISKEIAAPMRIAVALPVSVDINNSGEWITLPDGVNIWQQTVSAEGADGLIIRYDDFYIPDGGKLFIFNEDKSDILGAYTNKTHPGGGVFSNELIYGDKITFEYVESAISDEKPRLVLSNVGYAYNLKDNGIGVGSSQSCMININCEEGDNWRKQQRGAIGLTMFFDTFYSVCSGALVNNTRQDKTPYILSAHHCFEDNPEYATMQIHFNYERSGCSNSTSYTKNTLVGTQMLVDIPLSGASDGALLKLTNEIPPEYNVYYNGWDASGEAPSSGVIIHHPSGDVKKISTYTSRPGNTTWISDETGATNAHWRVRYAMTKNGWSVTEGGSSGSPIFNQNGLIIGTLTGGSSECSSPTASDLYGKLSYHWDKYSAAQMKRYLDPDNLLEGSTSPLKLDGYDTMTGIETIKYRDNVNFAVFPNPVAEELNINANNLILSVRIYDMTGALIYSKEKLNSSTITLPVTDWPKGLYLISINTESGKFSEKVLKD
ncbi:MAG: T9SS type A sorting domain-containing protein [Dysgonomonas sp.]